MEIIMKPNDLRETYKQAWDVESYGWELTFSNIELGPCGCQFDCLPWLLPVKLTEQETVDGLPSWWQINETRRLCFNTELKSHKVIPSEGLRLVVQDQNSLNEVEYRHFAFYREFDSARLALGLLIDFIEENWSWAIGPDDDWNSQDIRNWSNYEFFKKIKTQAYRWDEVDWFAIAYACLADDTGMAYGRAETLSCDVAGSGTFEDFIDVQSSGGGWVHYHFSDAPYLMAGLPSQLSNSRRGMPFEPFESGKDIQNTILNGDFEGFS